MDEAESLPILSVFDALQILQANDSIPYRAVKDICLKCNIPQNVANEARLNRKFNEVLKQQTYARKKSKLEEWTSGSKKEEFCRYLPEADEVIENNSSDEEYIPGASPPKRPRHRPKKPLTDSLNSSTINKRVSNIMPTLQDIADTENTSLMQFLIIVLVKLCRRFNFPNLANLLYTVFISMTDIGTSQQISVEKSAYMMVSQELGRDRYSDLRHTLMSEGCEAQPWYKVNAHCNAITPERIPVTIDPDEGVVGYRFHFEDACKVFVHRALLSVDMSDDEVPDNLYITCKDGADGSGQHFRRATVQVAVKGNILLYSFTPLSICSGTNPEGPVIWNNPAPNSALTQHPLAVIGAKEDKEDVLRPFIPQIEAEIIAASQNGIDMDYMGKTIHVCVHSSLTMMDGKMYSALQGTGGAYCQMCRTTKADCHDVEQATQGYSIDRNINDMHEIYSILTDGGEQPITKKPDDYETRAGVTSEPITKRDLNHGISATHAWLCLASFFLNILYHLVAKDKTWGFGNKADQRYKTLMKAKVKVQDVFEKVLGRRIDTADATGHSGNSLTGPLARRFFSKKCRDLLSQLVKGTDLDFIVKLHLNFSVILRIISSKDRKIDVYQFRLFCRNTYIDILVHFKWVVLTPTAHKVLAHAAELISNNSDLGLGNFSEEGLEACHKLIRRFRASWTLQSSDDANLKDLIKKLWLVSDPLFYSFRKTLKCPKCGSTGHQRKCPVMDTLEDKHEDDIMVEEMFVE